MIVVPVASLTFSGPQRAALWVLLPASLFSLWGTALLAYWQHRLSFVRTVRAALIGQVLSAGVLAALLLVARHWAETEQLLAIGACFLLGAALTFTLLVPRDLAAREGSSTRVSPLAGVTVLLLGALPLGISSSLSLLHIRADQIILASLGYRKGLADYAVAYQIIQGVIILLGSVAVVGFPLMARSEGPRRSAYSRQSVALLVVAGVLGAIAVVFLAPVGVLLLGGHRYSGAVRSCRLLAPVVVLSVANTMAGRVLILERRLLQLCLVTAPGLALNVALNLVLIPHLGVAGAASATVASEALGVVLVVLLANRALPGSQPAALLLVATAGTGAAVLVDVWVRTDGRPIGLGIGAVTTVATAIVGWRTWQSGAARLLAGEGGSALPHANSRP